MVFFVLLCCYLPFSFVLGSGAVSKNSCGKACCPWKVVGKHSYSFKHEADAKDAEDHGCQDNCVYTEDGGNGEHFCFKRGGEGGLPATCYNCKPLPKPPRKYTQPGQKLWPTDMEIEEFRLKINGGKLTSCLGLPKFIYITDEEAHKQICLNYTGLERNKTGDRELSGIYLAPDPNDEPNPFITGAYYNEEGKACMTPYQFLNNRNYKAEWMAAFIVTAETAEDIQNAVMFAKTHNLGISVMSTGHDLQDRNAGPGPNSLLIRTTCFREWTANLNTEMEDCQGNIWKEGIATVGAGLTFGDNFWPEVINAKGTYALAAESNREMVGGTCHSVGIVGYTLGGGRGWTAPKYGLGVDQLLHVDLITADGNMTSASPTINKDLFYAIRGGGGGFGIIYSMKIKLHYPSCKDLTDSTKYTMKNCYTMHNASWEGVYDKDETPDYVTLILKAYVAWSIENRKSWNSIVDFRYNKTSGRYTINIGANLFGGIGAETFKQTMAEFPEDRQKYNSETGQICQPDTSDPNCLEVRKVITDKYWCEIFPDIKNGNDCSMNPWDLRRWAQSIRFMVSDSIKTNSFIDDLIKTWQPSCDNYPYAPCASGYQIHGDLPATNPTTGLGVGACGDGGPVSEGFRNASFQVFNLGVNSAKTDLTFAQEEEWMHFTLGPALYTYSTASYFNEAEYTLPPGTWEKRFWGAENHCKLLEIKKRYDPALVFGCRHCVGSEVGSEPMN